MRLDHQGLELEVVKVFLDLLIARLGLQLDFRQRARQWKPPPFALLARHESLNVPRLRGWNSVACSGLEEDPRFAQRDRLVGLVGHDQPNRNHSMAEIIDAEDGLFFPGVVRLSGDRHLFVGMRFHCGKRRMAGCNREAACGRLPRLAGPIQKNSNGIVRKASMVLDCIILDWTAERRVRHA